MEDAAANLLQAQGLKLISKNFHGRSGEIDLIMSIDRTLVFVEVRYRRSERYGSGVETVDRRKKERIINTAHQFLFKNGGYEKYTYRFDIVSVTGELHKPEFEWISDAFEAQ